MPCTSLCRLHKHCYEPFEAMHVFWQPPCCLACLVLHCMARVQSGTYYLAGKRKLLQDICGRSLGSSAGGKSVAARRCCSTVTSRTCCWCSGARGCARCTARR